MITARMLRPIRRLVLLAVAAFAIAGPAQAYELFPEGAFAGRKPDLRNGEYMTNAAGCAGCHASSGDPKVLAGGLRMDSFIGTFFAPNITPSAAGIGSWSDAKFLNAVMFGVGHDGSNLYPVMPYAAYAGMNPEDVLDIKAYLATLPKADNIVEGRRVSFFFSGPTIRLWRRYNLTAPAFHPTQQSQLERGRYLVEQVGACAECHTPRTRTFGRDDSQRFAGAKTMSGAFAPDISAAKVRAVGDDAFFRALFVDGTKLNGAPFTDGTMRRIATDLGKLTEDDQRAMVAYLKGTEVSAPKLPSTPEAACKDRSGAAAKLADAGGNAELTSAADAFIGKYCKNCHGAGESDQGSYLAGDIASVAADTRFVTRGDRNSSDLFKVIKSGRMPKGARPSTDEIEQLGQWIDSLTAPSASQASAASAPARKRQVVPLHATAEQALHDLGQRNDGDKQFIRYVSFTPQYNGTLPCEDDRTFAKRLELYDAGFNKLLNSMSLGPSLIKPEKIAGSRNLVARIDIRDLGWTVAKWDMLARSYPYLVDPTGDDALNALSRATGTSMPILRADWFMANATRPALYYPLLDLPDNIRGVEQQIGVDANANIREMRVLRAGFVAGSSGVSDHNRMIERHVTGRRGYYWKSYDFSSSAGTQSLVQHPDGPPETAPLASHLEPFQHAGGEMIFSLPNGTQGYYLSKADGDRLDEGPTSIVAFRQRPIGKGIAITNARACFNCHADGIIAKRDQLRDLIDASKAFNADQRDLLEKVYVKQDELAKAYAADRATFISAIDQIGATEKAPDGSLKSRSGPNGEEIITYYADLYDDTLNADALAAEFDMTREDFERATDQLDSESFKVAKDFLNRAKSPSGILREEFEAQYALLAQPLTRLRPIKVASATGMPAASGHIAPPSHASAAAPADKLSLAIQIGSTNVKVNETLSFDVTVTKACELQILYIDSHDKVTEIPQAMIGAPFLDPNTPRHIPAEGSGLIRFDGAGNGETLFLSCRIGGLRDRRLTAEQAARLGKKSYLPITRSIEIIQTSKQLPTASSQPVSTPALVSAPKASDITTNFLTFNVRDE